MAINIPIVSKFDAGGVKQAEGAFGGMGKALLGLGAVIAAAFSVKAIVSFGKEATLAAEALQTSGARIDSIANSMGLFGDQTDAVTKRLKDFADANELAFAIDENSIMQIQATLLTFGEVAKTADEAGGAFDRATVAAIDLAAAGFGSAETNAIQLGKALNDPIKGLTALTRSGVTFTDAEKDLIKTMVQSGNVLGAQEMILAAIEQQVGGTAKATADASAQMALAFGEVKESVGQAILPAFQAVTAALMPLIEILLPKIKDFLERNLTPALMGAADAFSDFVGRIVAGESVGDIFTGMFSSITEWFTGGGLAAAFERMSEIRNNLIDAILAALPGILEGLVALLPSIVGFMTGTLLPQMVSSVTLIITSIAQLLPQIIPQIVNALVQVAPTIIKAIADLLPQIVTTIVGMLPTLLSTGVTLFLSLVNAVLAILPDLLKAIVGMLPEIVRSVIGMLPAIITAGIELFNGLIKAVIDVLPDLIKQILAMLPVILKTIIEMLPQLIQAAFQLFMGIVQGVLDALPEIIAAVIALLPEIITAFMNALPQIVVLGFEIVKGLVKGIIDAAPRLISNAIQSLFNLVSNTVKSVFGIASPSKVFIAFGGDMIDGLADGLKGGAREIKNAVEAVGDATNQAFDKYSGTIKAEANLTGAISGNMASARFAADMSAPPLSPVASPGRSTAATYNITVNAGMGADGNRIGETIVNEILKFEKSSGKVFARA
jgi:phage-related protein